MVGAVGIEPTTNGLKVRCSTTKIHPQTEPFLAHSSLIYYLVTNLLVKMTKRYQCH